MLEQCAIRGQGIHVGCPDGIITVASEVRALVIRYKEDDILPGSKIPSCGQAQKEEEQQGFLHGG